MGIIVGLDIGGSITKIVGFAGEDLLQLTSFRASDPLASAYGGLGKFLNQNKLRLTDVDTICVTGVGASHLPATLFDRVTVPVPEFDAVGLGGLYISGKDCAIVVSMGTGTSFVSANRETGVRHIIGSGVGGGTLLGLSSRMIQMQDFETISQHAENGSLAQVDLTIGDISRQRIPGLTLDTTASNFGKVTDVATSEDLALGIINLVFQSVGTMAVLSARLEKVDTIVFTGNLVHSNGGSATLARFSELYDVQIVIPPNATYATAIGAALTACQ